jgi:hypothetical protein
MTAEQIREHLKHADPSKHCEEYMQCVKQLLTLTDEQLIPIYEWHCEE